jgi:integrase
MAKVRQRTWKIPGQRTKRKAWGFTAQINGKQIRSYKAEWTQDDAEKALAEALLEVKAAAPAGTGVTFGEAVNRYLAAKARKRTVAADKRQFEHLKVAFGAGTPLAEITAGRISEYKAKRLASVRKVGEGDSAAEHRLSAAAVNRPLALLRHLLRLAHEEWEILGAIPRVRMEKEPQGRLRWLIQDEITRLLAACADSKNKELRPAVVVALNTGLRRGELLGLTWDRVETSRGVIRLEVTKSGRRREVPLNAESYAALVGLCPRDSGRVFRKQSIRKAYENAVSNAKLDDVNFHTLRHTFASWAVMRGVSMKELQELLGHASMAMTMRYAHLAPERLRSAVTRLEGLTSGEAAAPATAEPISASVNA